MGDKPAVQQAVQQALSEALGTIQRQLSEVESSFEQVKGLLEEAGKGEAADRFVTLLPPLIHMQAAGAALTASIETVLRFVGSSAHWTGLGAMAAAAAPAARAEAAAPAEEVPPEAPAEVAAGEPVPAEEAPAPAADEGTVSEVAFDTGAEAPAEAPPEPEAAPAPEPVDVSSLPDELKQLHKKAARFARVTVQELFMYKKEEVEKGRQSRDLYQRFREEIDKSKALYDQKFQQISDHNIDYLYDELVRVLAENDAGALGNYPYAPGR